MWEANYAAEPFDLRLTLFRLARNLGWLALFTLLGTALFGGGYYVKNVLLGEKPRYEQTITCKIEYTDPPTKSGDYYINEMTWNTYVNSDEFRDRIGECLNLINHMTEEGLSYGQWWEEARNRQDKVLSAAVASDIHVPSFTVSTVSEDATAMLSWAVQIVLTGDYALSLPEVASADVIDVTDMSLVYPDVRPLRAVILSAILSCFFTTVFFLLREIGADSIWLPATLDRRYGLAALGTIQSPELYENMAYLFRDKKRVAICTVSDAIDPQAVIKALQGSSAIEWIALPTPALSPETARHMREADGVLLVAEAGLHTGKPLEYVLEFLKTQEIAVTAALLWEADETLIKCYYALPDSRESN